MKVTPEDVENFFEKLAQSAPKLIAGFGVGESIDTSEGGETYPLLFLENDFSITEVVGGDNKQQHYEIYRFAFQVRDRVEEKTQFKAIKSKCKNTASYLVLKMQKMKFGTIKQVEHMLGREEGGDNCAFNRVELEIWFDRWVENCDLNMIFEDV